MFASRIMPASRIFSRRLYLATVGLKSLFSHFRLFYELKEDLMIWSKFLDVYNGKAFVRDDFVLPLIFNCLQMQLGQKVLGHMAHPLLLHHVASILGHE